jgi:hypothetical protein
MDRADEPLKRSSLERNGIPRAEPAEDVASGDHPSWEDQARLDDAYAADFTIVRALLKKGRAHEKAVDTFQPYDRIQEISEEPREGTVRIAGWASPMKPAFLLVNNRLGGNATSTNEAVIGRIGS